jgi:hypothetical protein
MHIKTSNKDVFLTSYFHFSSFLPFILLISCYHWRSCANCTLSKRITHLFLFLSLSLSPLSWEGSSATRMMVLGWFRAACTRHTSLLDYSIVDMGTRAIPWDAETVPWTMTHLQAIVPWPTQPAPHGKTSNDDVPATLMHEDARSAPDNTGATQTAELYNRIIALLDNILASKINKERPSETAKTLSEVERCRLLGFCGLGWQE